MRICVRPESPCSITQIKSHLPFPGVSISIDCGEGRGAYGLVNPSSCHINYFGAHPLHHGVGRIAYPLVESELKRIGCRRLELTPNSPRAEEFWKREGFECIKMFGGFCQTMAKDLPEKFTYKGEFKVESVS